MVVPVLAALVTVCALPAAALASETRIVELTLLKANPGERAALVR